MTTLNIIKAWEDNEIYYASIVVSNIFINENNIEHVENIEHIIKLNKQNFQENVSVKDIKDAFITEISNKINLERNKNDFSDILGETILN